jgi:A/G-specific adenine glycosylase
VGPYTAAAIRAFAFDASDVALDTNIRRVVHRLCFGIEFPPAVTNGALDAAAAALVPAGRGHAWNSAMMDLGATICTALTPKCLLCPLARHCAAAPVDPQRLATLARQHRKRSPQERLPFARTTRFLRGRVVDCLRDLGGGESVSLDDLRSRLDGVVPADRLAEIPAVVAALVNEGIVARSSAGIALSAH